LAGTGSRGGGVSLDEPPHDAEARTKIAVAPTARVHETTRSRATIRLGLAIGATDTTPGGTW
jgi:hypothetical protein